MSGGGDDPAAEAALVRERGAPLLEALEERLPDARRRGAVAARVGVELAAAAGLSTENAVLIGEAARLHEVGKLYLEPELLGRAEADLGPVERERLAAHAEHGHALALGAGVPAHACSWILHARERWDGAGPTGLAGADIPIAARIIAVAREYLAAPAPDPEADPREAAVDRLEALAGTVLDPALTVATARLAAG